MVIKVITSIIIGLISSALVEYLLHRFYLHKPNHSHLLVHHKEYRNNAFVQNVKISDVASSPVYIISNIFLYSMFFIIIFILNKFIGILGFFIAVSYTIWVELIHFEFHSNKDKFFKQYKWFSYLKKHHFTHHKIYNQNYNIGSDFWDVLLKTKTK